MTSLAELEQRLSALEDVSLGEAGNANYLTIINGLVGALFSGTIQAQGITLLQGSLPSSTIAWLTNLGAVIASLNSADLGGQATTTLTTGEATANTIIEAQSTTDNGYALVEVIATPGGPNEVKIQAAPPGGGIGKISILWDSTGASNFMQNADPLQRISHAGDPALVYISTVSAAVGAGVDFNYIAGVGQPITTAVDPGARWNGTGYVCRNTGIYEASGGISYPASSVNQVQVGAANNNSGYKIKALSLTPTAVAGAGHSFGGIHIPANAGEVIIPVAQLSASVSVGTLAGTNPATWFSCKQVQ